MSPAEAALAKLLGDRLGDIGAVREVALGKDSVRLVLDLAGQPGPVELSAEGLAWEPDGDAVALHWTRAGSSLPWLDRLAAALSARAGNRLRIPDSIRLVPLKLLLPRRGPGQPSK
jgi:hypothetical protein